MFLSPYQGVEALLDIIYEPQAVYFFFPIAIPQRMKQNTMLIQHFGLCLQRCPQFLLSEVMEDFVG